MPIYQKTLCAIDPGINGAIVYLSKGRISIIYDMPKEGKQVNLERLAVILRNHEKWVDEYVMEKVASSPQMGSASAFNFGQSAMAPRAMIAMLGQECQLIRPQQWKGALGLSGKAKKASIAKAKQLYPDCEFQLADNNDRADAICIGAGWLKIKALEEAI